MFERFTGALRADVVHAREQARELRDPDVDIDAAALASLGIDLDRVREVTDASLGPGVLERRRGPVQRGHLPFTKRAKKVLELALHEAVRIKPGEINAGHLLLGLLRDVRSDPRGSLAARMLAGADLDSLRADTLSRLEVRAA